MDQYGLFPHIQSLSRIHFLNLAYSKIHSSSVAASLTKAYRPSTNKQQQLAWKKFQDFIQKHEITSISTTTVLEFLRETFALSNLSPKTILTYRAALAEPLRVAFNIDVTSKPFKLLARSQFLERPPVQRLIPQWDLSKVLDLLKAEAFNTDTCSEASLLMKAVFLVALASGNRVSEIAAMQRTAIAYDREFRGVTLGVKPDFLYKNQRLGRTPPNIYFPSLLPTGEYHALCPVYTLRAYINKTSNTEHSAVFLSPLRGNRPLQSQYISLWICRLIEMADPDKLPRGHDLRKWASSIAWTRGVPPSQIVDKMFWSSSGVFMDKYLGQNNTPQCVALTRPGS